MYPYLFKKGDLVTFKSEHFIGIVQEVRLSDAFATEGLYEIKVLWIDYHMSFWCLEHALVIL
jgi:hypothetical protein